MALQFNFSHRFPGTVWSSIAYPQRHLIVLEVRDTQNKQVSFWALNYKTSDFVWKDQRSEESWWINLSGIHNDVLCFTMYVDTNNPDKKAVLAYSVEDFKLLWWNNDFSISSLGDTISGFTSKLGLKEQFLDVRTGNIVQESRTTSVGSGGVLKPVQYLEESDYFNTVKTFLADRLNFSAVSALEYLETETHILISCYEQEDGLANYLIVLSLEGELELKEKLDTSVQGIGLDTFFVVEGSLFFVKNKVELVSYTLI